MSYKIFLATAILILGLIGAIGPRTGQVYAQTPRPAADLVALYHQHILAINRGDLTALMAGYAAEATFIGPGNVCTPAVPCVGKEAIQQMFQRLIAEHLQAGVIELKATGSTVTGSLNIVNDGIRIPGYGVARIKVTTTFSGDKITRDVVEFDLSDPATAKYVNFVTLSSLLRVHYGAVNRGDVATALSVFTDDAVLVRAVCTAQVPCTGKAEIQKQVEREVGNQQQFKPSSPAKLSDDPLTVASRVEFTGLLVRGAGIERAVDNATITFQGDKISRLVHEQDLSDPQTIVWSNFLRVSGAIATRWQLLQRGDVAGVMALFTDDAVYAGWGLCAAAPCVGKATIQRQMEREVADNTRFISISGSARVVGEDFSNQVEIRSDSIKAAGAERVIAAQTAKVSGGKFLSLRYTLGTTDEQTAVFLAAQPLGLPRTGGQPLSAAALLAAAAGGASLALGWRLRRGVKLSL